MTNPMRRLKFIPWRSLFQVAGIIAVLVIVLDVLIGIGYTNLGIGRILVLLFRPPLGILVNLAVSLGIGALAVYLLEKLFPQVIINTATLWALSLCLLLCLWVKILLPLPLVIVSLDEIQLVGMIVGVFWKGRRYWR